MARDKYLNERFTEIAAEFVEQMLEEFVQEGMGEHMHFVFLSTGINLDLTGEDDDDDRRKVAEAYGHAMMEIIADVGANMRTIAKQKLWGEKGIPGVVDNLAL